MDLDRDMGELSADKLRFEAQWLEAVLDARDGYRAALGELLRTMPPPDQARPHGTTQGHSNSAPVRRPGTPACRGGPGPPTVKAPACPTSRPPR